MIPALDLVCNGNFVMQQSGIWVMGPHFSVAWAAFWVRVGGIGGARAQEGLYKDGLFPSGFDIGSCLISGKRQGMEVLFTDSVLFFIHASSLFSHCSGVLTLARSLPSLGSYLRRFGLPRSMRQATPSPGRLHCRIQSNMSSATLCLPWHHRYSLIIDLV